MEAQLAESNIGKLIEIDGEFYYVKAWSMDAGYHLEKFGNVLAWNILVEGDDGMVSLGDALLMAGWLPPETAEGDGDILNTLRYVTIKGYSDPPAEDG